MLRMKKQMNLLLGILLCVITCSSWAKENQIQFKVTGVQGQAYANVIDMLKNQQGLLVYPLTPAEINRFYELAPEAIQKALQPYGYFKPYVTSTIQDKNQVWQTNFTVETGPQMFVTSVDFQISGEGKNDPEFIKLAQNFPVQVNDALNIDFYNAGKSELFKIASTRGYFNSKITTSRVIINLKSYQAKVIIHFSTGNRFRFGETHFNSSPFAQSFLQRFLSYHQDEYYNYTKLQKTQQYFVTSNYFTQTLVTPDLDKKEGDIVPIDVHLIPQKIEQVTYGLGYGTDTGLRGTFGLNLRRINRYGHHMNFLGQLSTSGNHVITTNYYIPGKNPALSQYILSSGIGHIYIQNSTGNIVSTNEKLSAGYATYLGEIQQTIALTYLNERYTLPAFNLPYINSDVLYPSIIWQFVRRDKTFQPTRGFSAYSIISSSPWNITGVKFFQARVRLRALITPTENTRLLLRAEAGHTDINNLTQLPLSLQLLAGGVDSIRGFSFDSIGPGRNLFVGSVEIQRRIKGQLYLGLFVDSGTLFQNTWYTGVGPAVIYVSPVGTIEASLARSTNVNQKTIYFDFSMGQDL